jgi:long-chain acyl-CoA synthetase
MPSNEQALLFLFNPATSAPDKAKDTAIIQAGGNPDGSDRTVSYTDFEKLIAIGVAEFKRAGIGKQDKVMLTAANCAEMAAATAALWRLGAVAVPVDFRLTEKEVENVANAINVKLLCGSSRYNPNLSSSYQNANATKFDLAKLSTLLGDDSACDKDALQPIDLKNLDLASPALIILTSGTTGIPKGAVHDLGTLVTNLLELGPLVKLNKDTKVLLPLPLSHIFGMEVFYACYIYGAPVLFNELSPQSFFVCAKKYAPEILCGVPTLYGAMLGLPPGMVDLSKTEVLLCGGAPLPLSLAQEFEKKYGKRLNNGYGSTESKVISLNINGPVESVGKIIPSVKVEIVDGENNILPSGETGEIRISGPCLMLGYLDNPQETAKVLNDHQYHTGDMGYVKDGYLFISGRNKEMIVVAGNKVFPTEVEDVLRQHPLVKEVAVVGIPNKQLGQAVKAIIVVREGELSDKLEGDGEVRKAARQELIAQLRELCKQQLKRELRPMDWDFFPASQPLPKTSSGKVDKKQLLTELVTAGAST